MTSGPEPNEFDEGEILDIADAAREALYGDAYLVPSRPVAISVGNFSNDIVIYALRSRQGVERALGERNFVLEVTVLGVDRGVKIPVLRVRESGISPAHRCVVGQLGLRFKGIQFMPRKIPTEMLLERGRCRIELRVLVVLRIAEVVVIVAGWIRKCFGHLGSIPGVT